MQKKVYMLIKVLFVLLILDARVISWYFDLVLFL